MKSVLFCASFLFKTYVQTLLSITRSEAYPISSQQLRSFVRWMKTLMGESVNLSGRFLIPCLCFFFFSCSCFGCQIDHDVKKIGLESKV